MPHFSLSPKFIKESILLFRKKPLTELFFGNRVSLDQKQSKLLRQLESDFAPFAKVGGRHGTLVRSDALHKGRGQVYLIPNQLGSAQAETLLLLSDDTVITAGPDLYVYLSKTKSSSQPTEDYLNAGDLKGTKGGQAYIIKQSVVELAKYQYVLIYCKQFSILFSPAELA